ncbi:R-spondin-2 Cysteine-rich and single thrombospondin domain-containing protein 2 [Channa argus]|uniref:R-spondin-2 n=1 Tax=Channa argus TaxID=215402 RepID=A0A6G1PNN2_CHAAH|nr:R-spondin-2 Cysteine-rich and single thrombospondin domain-containing protein 2 [Channa argus]
MASQEKSLGVELASLIAPELHSEQRSQRPYGRRTEVLHSKHAVILHVATSYGAYPTCKGCSVCSRDNGCVNCQPKLFLFLRRERMRQYGECLHDCPAGYYGMRSPELNMCSRCRIENCESCFSKDFCTKCKSGFYLHKGRCFDKCPEGFAPLEETMECGEGCEVGQWSEWGACTRRNKTCGYKWGLETRTRHIVKKPPKDTIPCPTIAESRMCKMAVRHCRRERAFAEEERQNVGYKASVVVFEQGK